MYLGVEVIEGVTGVKLKINRVCQASDVEAIVTEKVLVTELGVKTD